MSMSENFLLEQVSHRPIPELGHDVVGKLSETNLNLCNF
jgi:hypothetical protein